MCQRGGARMCSCVGGMYSSRFASRAFASGVQTEYCPTRLHLNPEKPTSPSEKCRCEPCGTNVNQDVRRGARHTIPACHRELPVGEIIMRATFRKMSDNHREGGRCGIARNRVISVPRRVDASVVVLITAFLMMSIVIRNDCTRARARATTLYIRTL